MNNSFNKITNELLYINMKQDDQILATSYYHLYPIDMVPQVVGYQLYSVFQLSPHNSAFDCKVHLIQMPFIACRMQTFLHCFAFKQVATCSQELEKTLPT